MPLIWYSVFRTFSLWCNGLQSDEKGDFSRRLTVVIPKSWQAHGVLPEHLLLFKNMLQEQRDADKIDVATILEKLPPQLKALGQTYNNATHDEFTGYRDEVGDVFFLDLKKGHVMLCIGWHDTRFAAETSGITLRKLDGIPQYIDLFIGHIYYR